MATRPQYQRRFNWDEAIRLYAEGTPTKQIATRLGVSDAAIRRVVVPGERERMAARSREWQRTGRCDECGGQMNRCSRNAGCTRCRACATAALATNVRDGELRCSNCGEWKPDEGFPFNRAGRKTHRGRHGTCRSCLTVLKRKWRSENRERDNATTRRYRRNKRTAMQKATGRV